MHSKQSIFYLLEFIQLNFIPIYLQLIGYQFLKAPDCVNFRNIKYSIGLDYVPNNGEFPNNICASNIKTKLVSLNYSQKIRSQLTFSITTEGCGSREKCFSSGLVFPPIFTWGSFLFNPQPPNLFNPPYFFWKSV